MAKGDIKILLLHNGQEIIGEIVSMLEGDAFEMINILQVGMIMPRPGQTEASVGMGPWIPYRDTSEPVTFWRDHVIADMKPSPELLMNYQKAFTKIITPTSLIVPGR